MVRSLLACCGIARYSYRERYRTVFIFCENCPCGCRCLEISCCKHAVFICYADKSIAIINRHACYSIALCINDRQLTVMTDNESVRRNSILCSDNKVNGSIAEAPVVLSSLCCIDVIKNRQYSLCDAPCERRAIRKVCGNRHNNSGNCCSACFFTVGFDNKVQNTIFKRLSVYCIPCVCNNFNIIVLGYIHCNIDFFHVRSRNACNNIKVICISEEQFSVFVIRNTYRRCFRTTGNGKVSRFFSYITVIVFDICRNAVFAVGI